MPKYAVVNTDKLNLRSAANLTASVVSVMPKGTVLQVVNDPGGDWVQVQIDGASTQGYSARSFLAFSDTKRAPAPATARASAPAASGAGTPAPGDLASNKALLN